MQPNPSQADHRYVIIMAGGRGERFWPVSRQTFPKQLVTLFGGRSLLQQACDRVLPIVDASHIFVITNVAQVDAVRKQLPELPAENIIAEPCGRDTCAAVTLGAALVAARDEDGVMSVLSADHLIPDEEVFRQVLIDAYAVAGAKSVLVTLGINPTEPATGYGYIHLGAPCNAIPDSATQFFQVRQFVEKPNLETARAYLDSGEYRWNAGMFLWSCKTLYSGLQAYTPQMAEAFCRWKKVADSWCTLEPVLAQDYPNITKISVDFALMEHAKNIVVANSTFAWDDLGTWSALTRHIPPDNAGNCANVPFVAVDSRDNLIFDNRKKLPRTLTAMLGVHNMVIVFTDDATLVANKSDSQRMKELVAQLGENPDFKKLM